MRSGSEVNQSTTMVEKANFIQLKARKGYFNVEIEYLLGNSTGWEHFYFDLL